MNPLLAIVNELISSGKADVTITNKAEYKSKCESIGAKFIENVHIVDAMAKETSGDNIYDAIALNFQQLDLTNNSFNWMLKLYDDEKPDFIFYDQFFYPGQYLVDYLSVKRNDKVKFTAFSTMFNYEKEQFDVQIKKVMKWYELIYAMLSMFIVMSKHLLLKLKYGVHVHNIVEAFFPTDVKTMTTVLYELQPKASLYKNVKYVGPCISTVNKNNNEIFDSTGKLKEILDRYEEVNPLPLNDYFLPNDSGVMSMKNRLVYVSFGTIFNNNPDLMIKVIQSFEILDKNKLSVDVVVSLGKSMFEIFKQKIENGKNKKVN
jgi:UDP:flavonoid glycosyltransferase YjiC (YdhE family)